MSQINNANDLVTKLLKLGDVAIYLLFSLAVVFIIWHVVFFIIHGSNPEEKSKHLANVGWGILGLFIIFSIWGLVNIVLNTFKTNNTMPTDKFPTANFVNK